MSSIEDALQLIDDTFRRDSKQWKAARYIVRQDHEILGDERKAICNEIPISYKALQGLFTKLRKMGLYPPQPFSEIPREYGLKENPPENHEEYATKKDLESLRDSIDPLIESVNYLAKVISGDPPSNLEPNPGVYEEEIEEEVELIPQQDLLLEESSLTRKTILLKPKTQMYFDMARQGVFSNYVGSRELGPFTNFSGNLSDFFNTIVDDYFIHLYNADIGLMMRRYAQ